MAQWILDILEFSGSCLMHSDLSVPSNWRVAPGISNRSSLQRSLNMSLHSLSLTFLTML